MFGASWKGYIGIGIVIMQRRRERVGVLMPSSRKGQLEGGRAAGMRDRGCVTSKSSIATKHRRDTRQPGRRRRRKREVGWT